MTFKPVILSSIEPSTLPKLFCCATKKREARPPIILVLSIIAIVPAMTTSVIQIEKKSITNKQPTTVKPVARIFGNDCEINCLIVSISFVYNDMIEPV